MQTVCRYSSEVPEAPFYAVSGDAVVVPDESEDTDSLKFFQYSKIYANREPDRVLTVLFLLICLRC